VRACVNALLARCILVSDANPMVGPGLRGCKNRPTDFGSLTRVDFVPADGSVRDSATGGLAGSAKTLLECANFAARPRANGGLGLAPHAVVDMAFHGPLALLGVDPPTLEDAWAKARRTVAPVAPVAPPTSLAASFAAAAGGGSAAPPARGFPAMAVAWNGAKGAFEVV